MLALAKSTNCILHLTSIGSRDSGSVFYRPIGTPHGATRGRVRTRSFCHHHMRHLCCVHGLCLRSLVVLIIPTGPSTLPPPAIGRHRQVPTTRYDFIKSFYTWSRRCILQYTTQNWNAEAQGWPERQVKFSVHTPYEKTLGRFSAPQHLTPYHFVDLPVGDRASARFRVLFGQPVKLGGASFGVIRIALGADMLIDAFCRGNPPLAEETVAAMGTNGSVARLLAQVIASLRSCLEFGLSVIFCYSTTALVSQCRVRDTHGGADCYCWFNALEHTTVPHYYAAYAIFRCRCCYMRRLTLSTSHTEQQDTTTTNGDVV